MAGEGQTLWQFVGGLREHTPRDACGSTPGEFTTHVLEDPLGQAGGMKFADLDEDGTLEVVVTAYEESVVYIYHWEEM